MINSGVVAAIHVAGVRDNTCGAVRWSALCWQNVELYIKTQSVPRSKHYISVIRTSQLMLYRVIIAVCSQIHTKHINTLCGQNVELYIKTQSVPRSKHTPSRLYKPVS